MQHLQIAIVLVWRDHRVLVQRRLATVEHLPNLWEFPGGKCKAGESPHQAAIREAREELGVEIEIIGERQSITHEYEDRKVTLHPFDAQIVKGEAEALASSQLRWMFPIEMKAEGFPSANALLIGQLQKEE
ncbi:MAG TPA: (deoxy)nucleoside triphosphate pyrophosphohydrolase [Abditibacteriaceae bacterium]|nr:(deoxy)nucleoside triphosphate pyrophosphohydrolase [Abditibacteriaceae bacterium]